MTNVFEITNLKKNYSARTVLDIDRAEISAGCITALVGPNGCGKTTLLECLNGIMKPDTGEIHFLGAPLTRTARRKMTLVFQTSCLFNKSVAFNVAYGLRMRGAAPVGRVADALAAVGLSGFERRAARTLSGGEARRVAIARALAIQPDALLLDEPTANIDAASTLMIENAVRAHCERGASVIMATHSREQAVRLAHNVLLIHEGRLVPFHPDNHFAGMLSTEGGDRIFTINGGLRIVVTGGRSQGPASCTIPPEDIIVSAAPIESSARNCLKSRVTAVALEENGLVRLTAHAGAPLTAVITRASHDTLRPALDSMVWLTFKASSVKVF